MRPSASASLLRPHASQIVAAALVLVSFALARQPQTAPAVRESLAERFHFSQHELTVSQQDALDFRAKRQVHPSLERISAWISGTGAACTLADLDGDGLPNDLCWIDPRLDRVEIRPAPTTGDRYAPLVLRFAPLFYDAATMSPTGAVAGDFNEDGRMDLLIYFWGRTPVLMLRNTDRRSSAPTLTADDFTPCELVAGQDSAAPLRWYSHAATQADFDGDGHVDLIVGNFFQDGAEILNANGSGIATVMHEGKSKAANGGGAKLFLWSLAAGGEHPSVSYRDCTQVLDDLCGRGWVLAAAAADLDNDGLPEIYLAHDFGPDRLLHNRSRPGEPRFALCEGHRSFTTPKSFVLGKDSFKGMGVDFADVNGDGFFDIYVSNIADEWALQESHFLWLSTAKPDLLRQGVAPYEQASERLGLSRSGWGWDCKLADFDNDGVLEAIQATGFCRGTINRWPELQALGTSNDRIIHDPRFWPKFMPGSDISGDDRNPFFVRGQDGRFVNVAAELKLNDPMNTRGIAIDDVDGDGLLDFVVANQWAPSYFFKNESKSGNAFLQLELLLPLDQRADRVEVRPHGSESRPLSRPAIGAVAVARLPDGRKLMAQADGGSGHAGRRSPAIHFGLGTLAADADVPVELRWRDASGKLREHSISVRPGSYTIVLGGAPSETVP